MNKPTLVVMAAGMGSRFGGLKQMTPVDDHGNSLMHYSIYDALSAGFGKVVFIIKEAIAEDFRKMTECVARHTEVAYVNQEISMLPEGFSVPEGRAKPWGTGHAVLCAAHEIPGAFAAVNADDFYGRGAYVSIASFLLNEGGETDYAMVGYRLKNAITANGSVTRGLCKMENGFLTGITEQTNIFKEGEDAAYTDDGEHFVHLPGSTLVSMNFWGYRSAFLRELEARFPKFLTENLPVNPNKSEFFLPVVTDALIKEGRCSVRVLETDEAWHGVTYREDLPGVQAAIAEMHRQGKYPEILFP